MLGMLDKFGVLGMLVLYFCVTFASSREHQFALFLTVDVLGTRDVTISSILESLIEVVGNLVVAEPLGEPIGQGTANKSLKHTPVQVCLHYSHIMNIDILVDVSHSNNVCGSLLRPNSSAQLFAFSPDLSTSMNPMFRRSITNRKGFSVEKYYAPRNFGSYLSIFT
jgi:hypothetical protein